MKQTTQSWWQKQPSEISAIEYAARVKIMDYFYNLWKQRAVEQAKYYMDKMEWDFAAPGSDVTVYGCKICGFFAHIEEDFNKHKCWEPVTCQINQ